MQMTTEAAGSGKYTAEQRRFASLMEPLRPSLQAYCRSIAHSSWEADDLAQDTWVKAYRMYLRDPSRTEMSKSYLYRIAHNTWIDRCRRKQRQGNGVSSETLELVSPSSVDPIELRGAMETLIAHLPARQRVVVLLVEALGFTAQETARLLGTTEGAVKAGLHRARTKLKSVRDEAAGSSDEGKLVPERGAVDEHVVYAYLQAFQQHNPFALARLLNEETRQDLLPAVVGMQSGKRRKAAAQPDPVQSRSPIMAA